MNASLVKVIFFALFGVLIVSSIEVLGQKEKCLLFVGSYTQGLAEDGLYVFEFNQRNGRLKHLSTFSNVVNPSFISLSPNGRFLYACTETKLEDAGSISAYEIDSVNGRLRFINKTSAGGDNPVYVAVSQDGQWVVGSNYSGGSIAAFTTNKDGSLNDYSQLIEFKDSSIIKNRQEASHIHSGVFSPDHQFLFFPDLGGDKIRVVHFDSTIPLPMSVDDELTVDAILGSGPRHFEFHPNGKWAYCVEELSGQVSGYNYFNGELNSFQRIFAYSKTQEVYNSADIHISPDGLFLYVSNRWDNENTIAIFSIDTITGQLKLVGHQSTLGDHPRNFAMDHTGKFLIVANQASGDLVVFKRNSKTGLLKSIGKKVQVPRASCLKFRLYKG